tara:strand:- start:210 stop:1337 length:1128 start_codon:yes stop_codon:yes gene_type:complete
LVEQRTENPRVGGSNPPLGTIRERLMFKKIFLLIAIALICSSCESPTTITSRGLDSENEKERAIMQGIALETYYNRVEKLNNIAWPILSSSLNFCKENITDTIGIEVISLNEIDKNYRNAASEKIGLTNEPQILYVVESSPADISGLKKKDKIIKISSPEYSWGGDDIIKNTRKRIFGKNKIRVKVERDNEILIFEVNPVKICNHRIILRQDNSLNAFADGKNIYITQGMLRFIDEDKELQMVIAHELAHNIEGHIEKKTNNYLLGTIVDLAAAGAGVNTRGTFGSLGAQMYSQDFEREADYVGMYILANSGIEREGVANFWRRMSVENPRSISYASTHPSSSERWVNIEAVNKEIDKKILESKPLLPERVQIED